MGENKGKYLIIISFNSSYIILNNIKNLVAKLYNYEYIVTEEGFK